MDGSDVVDDLGPTLWVLRSEVGALWRNAARTGEVRGWGGALAITFVANCAIGPTAPRYGLAQSGFTQVCLLGFLPLVFRMLDRAPSVRLRRIVRWHVLTGFAPFAVLSIGMLLALHLPRAGNGELVAKLASADGDFWTFRHLGLASLAGRFFPGGLVLFALAIAAFWSGAIRVSGQNVRARRADRSG